MGKHEAPENSREIPEEHLAHRRVGRAVSYLVGCSREVLLGGSAIMLFEWIRPQDMVSTHTAIVWVVSNVQI